LLFVIALGIDLGAGIYEARIVVPLWANSIPESLEAGNPYRRVAIDAGMRFWAYVTTAVAFLAVLSLVLGLYAPAAQRAWRTFAAVAELAVVAGTLLYFRPTLVRLFMSHGAGLSPAAVASTVPAMGDVEQSPHRRQFRCVVCGAQRARALMSLSCRDGVKQPYNDSESTRALPTATCSSSQEPTH
jgi:hypothetical protein